MNTADENNAKKGFRIRWDWFPVTFLIAFFCCFLWGSASPAIKIAYQLFRIDSADTASRILLAGSRFTLAGCMTIIRNPVPCAAVSAAKRLKVMCSDK